MFLPVVPERLTAAQVMRTPVNSLLVVLLASALLGGCSEKPRNVLVPVASSAPGASRVDLLVATTRRPSDEPGQMFTGERGRELSFADISVSIPPAAVREVGQVQWPSGAVADPATEFATLHANRISQPQAAGSFKAALKRQPNRRVLLFVHGYNTQFSDAVYGFAQFVHDSGTPAVPLLFTWPSRAQLLAYGYDRESANFSRDALEGVLLHLAADPDVREISILAHSMGTWLTMEALRQSAIRKGRVPEKIRDVILAAPDIDVDVFRRQVRLIGEKRPRITIFASQDDKALEASRRVWQSSAQLGAINAESEPYKSSMAKLGLTVINLTDVKSTDSLAHGKFASSPDVVKFIGNRLASGHQFNPDANGSGAEQIGSFIGGVTSSAGKLVGAVVTAPLAVVDPGSRKALGEQIESLTGKEDKPEFVE